MCVKAQVWPFPRHYSLKMVIRKVVLGITLTKAPGELSSGMPVELNLARSRCVLRSDGFILSSSQLALLNSSAFSL